MKERPIIMTGDSVKGILADRKTQTRRVITKHNSIIGEGGDWNNLDFYAKTFLNDRLKAIMRDASPGSIADISLKDNGRSPLPWADNSVPHWQYLHVPYNWSNEGTIFRVYPRWEVGDRLWVRETFCEPTTGGITYRADEKPIDGVYSYHSWKPSIFMPRWASRILLEIVEVRAEKLCDISEQDAKSEGANPHLLDKLIGGSKYKMLKTYHYEAYPLIDHADEGETVIFECPNMGFARLHHTQWREKQDPVFRIPGEVVFEYVGSLEPDYKNGFKVLWDSINGKKYPWDKNPWVWVITFGTQM